VYLVIVIDSFLSAAIRTAVSVGRYIPPEAFSFGGCFCFRAAIEIVDLSAFVATYLVFGFNGHYARHPLSYRFVFADVSPSTSMRPITV
jgi:hypothetical protein